MTSSLLHIEKRRKSNVSRFLILDPSNQNFWLYASVNLYV